MDTAHGFEREAIWSNPVTNKDHDQRLVWLINADFFDHASLQTTDIIGSSHSVNIE